MAEIELKDLQIQYEKNEKKLKLFYYLRMKLIKKMQIEIRAGTGGLEASLFAMTYLRCTKK